MFQNIGTGEIIIIAIVLMVLFGGQKFPELAKGIADAMKEFRRGLNEDDEDEDHPKKPKKKSP